MVQTFQKRIIEGQNIPKFKNIKACERGHNMYILNFCEKKRIKVTFLHTQRNARIHNMGLKS